jgi:hypothetical protein
MDDWAGGSQDVGKSIVDERLTAVWQTLVALIIDESKRD